MRLLLLLPVVFLLACPPTRGTDGVDDDDDATSAPGVDEIYDGLQAEQCQAFWSGGAAAWMGLGTGYGTTGLWNALDCNDSSGAGITFELQYLDAQPGTSMINEINARSANASAGMESIDNIELHIEQGDWQTIGGWWEGEAELTSAAGESLVLEAVVFKGLRVDQVAGR